jgi:hypothetical protein
VTRSRGTTAYLIKGGTFTTHDSSKPDFRLHAHKIRLYDKDRVIFLNVTATSGRCRCFGFRISTNRSTTRLVLPSRPRITAPGDHRFLRRSRSRSQTIFKPGSGWIISAGGDQPSALSRQLNMGKTNQCGADKDFLHQRPKPGYQSNQYTASRCA